MVVHQQKEKQCVLENLILQEEDHFVQDTTVTIQDQKLKQDIGVVEIGKINEVAGITEAEFEKLAEKKDACYHKVKARYKVWPSAYASGALVQCRKKGAANWGTGGKKKK